MGEIDLPSKKYCFSTFLFYNFLTKQQKGRNADWVEEDGWWSTRGWPIRLGQEPVIPTATLFFFASSLKGSIELF